MYPMNFSGNNEISSDSKFDSCDTHKEFIVIKLFRNCNLF